MEKNCYLAVIVVVEGFYSLLKLRELNFELLVRLKQRTSIWHRVR